MGIICIGVKVNYGFGVYDGRGVDGGARIMLQSLISG